jgi:small subunit ribosomal protein S6
MRTYEVLFILSPQLAEEDSKNLITEFRGVIEKEGATVASEDAWGRRRLAYPIGKVNEGIYHLFVVNSENDLHELDRRMKNSDQVLRHMIVRTDLEQKRAVKLAKKNPKKPRTGVPSSAPAASAAPVAPAAPVEAEPSTDAGAEAAPAAE